LKGPEIPVARVEEAVNRLQTAYSQRRQPSLSFREWVWEQPQDYFEKSLADLTHIYPSDLPAVARDIGDLDDFRVTQFGGGECAGVSAESIAALFAELRHERNYREVFLRQRMYAQATDCVSHQIDLVEKTLPSIFSNIANASHKERLVNEIENRLSLNRQELRSLRDDSSEAELNKTICKIDQIIAQCEEVYASPLTANVITKSEIDTIDLTADVTPLVFLKLKKELSNHQGSESLHVRVANDTPIDFLKSGLEKTGYTIAPLTESGEKGVCLEISRAEACTNKDVVFSEIL
jgi:hypothetical protein